MKKSETTDVLPLAHVVQGHVESVVALMGGNKTRAAKALGIDRRTLHRMLHRYEKERTEKNG